MKLTFLLHSIEVERTQGKAGRGPIGRNGRGVSCRQGRRVAAWARRNRGHAKPTGALAPIWKMNLGCYGRISGGGGREGRLLVSSRVSLSSNLKVRSMNLFHTSYFILHTSRVWHRPCDRLWLPL